MQNSLVSLLSSYDIFGKSIPGAVFFLGVITLLPANQNSTPNTTGAEEAASVGVHFLTELSPRNLVPILALALVLGLIFGEGVHTLAVNSERFVAWFGSQTLTIVKVVQRIFPELYQRLTQEIDYSQLSEERSSAYDRLRGVGHWFERRYYGTTDAFIGHRRLFAIECVSNYNDEPGRRKESNPKHIYERFQTRFDEMFERQLPKEGEEELMEIYPLVTSVVTRSGGQQYRRFQSVYSFCRSMWVSLALIAAGHGILLSGGPVPISQQTVGAEMFSQLSIPPVWLPIGLGAGALFFIDATGTYKRHYVEYLVAEFSLQNDLSSSSTGGDDEESD